jgi:hypothetical protein
VPDRFVTSKARLALSNRVPIVLPSSGALTIAVRKESELFRLPEGRLSTSLTPTWRSLRTKCAPWVELESFITTNN